MNPGVPVTDRYVAFIDLLGFKSKVEAAEQDAVQWPHILTVLGLVKACLSESERAGLRLSTFSDCIVISAHRTPIGLQEMLASIRVLTLDLLQHDVLIRGGLTAGLAFHDDQFVFGSAVTAAYLMECSTDGAVWPMTMVSSAVVEDLKRFGVAPWSILAQDNHRWFVDVLAEFAAFNPAMRLPGMIPLDKPAIRIQQFISRRLREHVGPIREKARWMADYWNRRVAIHGHFAMISPDMPLVDPLPGATIVYRAIASS